MFQGQDPFMATTASNFQTNDSISQSDDDCYRLRKRKSSFEQPEKKVLKKRRNRDWATDDENSQQGDF